MALSEAQLLEKLTDQAFEIDKLGAVIDVQNKTIRLLRKQRDELSDRLGAKGRPKKRGH